MSGLRSDSSAVLVAAILSLSACGKETDRKDDGTDVAVSALASVAWRVSPDGFSERLGRVKKGWTRPQVLDLAGPPDEQTPDSLFYRWSEMGSMGGMFRYYSFKLEDDVVVDIRTGAGCKTVQPRPVDGTRGRRA